MADNYGELKTMQSGKEIDLNTTVPAMIDFFNALRQAKTGNIPGDEKKYNTNQRKLNQVQALNLLISTQETLITLASGQVEHRSRRKYEIDNKNKTEEDEIESFEENIEDLDNIKYDYNKLRYWIVFLGACRQEIIKAEKSKTREDDFLLSEQFDGEEVYRLTTNFWEMLADLEFCFKSIHQILMVNKVIASGVEENEELTYRELEEAFKTRVMEA